ncbi:MAG TPA: SpoIIE family protein phosphatase [Candidatus Acidoferrum sp.]|nr:SpoIIE family protein phosphatase [Candidatus Acidoferrum sp.]
MLLEPLVLQPVQLTESQLRWGLLNSATAVVLLMAGFGGFALFFLRRKSRDLTLIYFGIFCVLYAVRLLTTLAVFQALTGWSVNALTYLNWFITCTIIIPFFLFLDQVVTGNLQKLVKWLLAVQIAFGCFGIAAAIYGFDLRKLYVANNLLVISTVFAAVIFLLAAWLRPGTHKPFTHHTRVFIGGSMVWFLFVLQANVRGLAAVRGANFEFIGFLVFVGCLGYIAAHRTFANEERLLAINKELEIARQIQSSTLPQSVPRVEGLEIAAGYVPMSAVAGDFYDFLVVDDRHIGVLVADVTGHGVPAALIASMLKVAFAEQFPHAADPARVLEGVNRALCGKFEEHFVTAAYVFADLDRQVMRYAGAGHPPLMLASGLRPGVRQIEENGLMLGLFREATYSTVELALQPQDRCMVYTDGAFEATNAALEEFGKPRLQNFLETHIDLPAQRFTGALLDEISRWAGHAKGRRRDDDITLLVLDFRNSKEPAR